MDEALEEAADLCTSIHRSGDATFLFSGSFQ
jgi:hypothetical protein